MQCVGREEMGRIGFTSLSFNLRILPVLEVNKCHATLSSYVNIWKCHDF